MSLQERIMLGTWGIAMLAIVFQMYRWHITKDEGNMSFDLRKFITARNATTGIEEPDLSKLSILVALIASTYCVMTGKGSFDLLAVYLGAWVLNRAVTTGGRVLPTMYGEKSKIKTPAEIKADKE